MQQMLVGLLPCRLDFLRPHVAVSLSMSLLFAMTQCCGYLLHFAQVAAGKMPQYYCYDLVLLQLISSMLQRVGCEPLPGGCGAAYVVSCGNCSAGCSVLFLIAICHACCRGAPMLNSGQLTNHGATLVLVQQNMPPSSAVCHHHHHSV